jgi:hypothetical protein
MTLEGAITVDFFYAYFRPRFLIPLTRLLDIGSKLMTELGSDDAETEFDAVFSIGPGGVDFLVTILDHIYHGIDQTYHLAQGDEGCLAVIAEVHSASRSLLFSLQHFRAKHPRCLWDPKGCRDLIELFRTGESKLPVSLQPELLLTPLIRPGWRRRWVFQQIG